ncbi:hypothetical protein QUB47_27395 [Microcoleus sp. AT9_B5]
MDKSLILEKVQSFVANYHKVDLSEVTVNTKISNHVKSEYKPSMDKPSFSNLWNFDYSRGISNCFDTDLDKIEIIMGLEDVFDITISDEESDNIITVQQVVDCIFQKLNV